MIGSYKLGFEHSLVEVNGQPYLERWVVAVAGWTFRVHKFHRGDDERAQHNHPWAFWTFPFSSYFERTDLGVRKVKAWRLHYRDSKFRHIVMCCADHSAPWWTFVITKRYCQSWGFYPTPDKFVPWREWLGN